MPLFNASENLRDYLAEALAAGERLLALGAVHTHWDGDDSHFEPTDDEGARAPSGGCTNAYPDAARNAEADAVRHLQAIPFVKAMRYRS